MADEAGGQASLPEAAIERGRRLPVVWLIPIVAALAAAWLAYTTYSQTGPTITITFETAKGLEPGKTPIKYRDVTMGVVKTVELSEDLSHVIVTAQMTRNAAPQLREGTSFWVERAQLTAAGVSGLGTLLSGVYIGVRPGPGAAKRTFDGLKQPPIIELAIPGKTFRLHAKRLGSISSGSPVYFRGIPVGEVVGYALDGDGNGVTISVFVASPHDVLVRNRSRFWNASGVDLSLGASGLKVRTESLASIVEGGVAFDTPVDATSAEPSADGAEFPLYPSYEGVEEAQYTEKLPALLYFEGSVAGLEPGAPVLLRGITVGVVRGVRLEIDAKTSTIRIPVIVDLEPQRVTILGGDPQASPEQKVKRLVERGLRAQLGAGNLLTGALVVNLDFFPNEPPAQVTVEDGYPVIPTVPSQVEQIVNKATIFIDQLAKAPVAELVTDLRNAIQEADKVLSSKGLHQGVEGLRDVGPLIDSLKQTSETARGTLAQAETTLKTADGTIGPDSVLRYDLARMIKELTDTARSLRILADYLENNPNALIFGKKTQGDK
ncbi:MAG TPA: MlaD family protein [Candidatus Bathyarchaeia archaeon]|nr:MlaD family protein [Candidatus Bathyarchaeia archaeon]